MNDPKRFAVGAKVRVKVPGVNGVVTQVDDEPTVLSEYWHTIQRGPRERREPGCNLEPVSTTVPNPEAGATNAPVSNDRLFLQMREKVRGIADRAESRAIGARLNELEEARGSYRFLQA